MSMGDVLFQVAKERGLQDFKWGGPAHDDEHEVSHFMGFIGKRVDYSKFLFNNRQNLIEIAALAVAAIESIDRKAK